MQRRQSRGKKGRATKLVIALASDQIWGSSEVSTILHSTFDLQHNTPPRCGLRLFQVCIAFLYFIEYFMTAQPRLPYFIWSTRTAGRLRVEAYLSHNFDSNRKDLMHRDILTED
jgi:hypothetical protein